MMQLLGCVCWSNHTKESRGAKRSTGARYEYRHRCCTDYLIAQSVSRYRWQVYRWYIRPLSYQVVWMSPCDNKSRKICNSVQRWNIARWMYTVGRIRSCQAEIYATRRSIYGVTGATAVSTRRQGEKGCHVLRLPSLLCRCRHLEGKLHRYARRSMVPRGQTFQQDGEKGRMYSVYPPCEVAASSRARFIAMILHSCTHYYAYCVLAVHPLCIIRNKRGKYFSLRLSTLRIIRVGSDCSTQPKNSWILDEAPGVYNSHALTIAHLYV